MIVGTGVDLVEISRVEDILKRWGDHFRGRVFTSSEVRYCERFRHKGERYAARFAAKEAAFKALGTGWRGGIRWRDVEVRVEESGRPRIHLKGEAKRRADSLGAGRVWVSLSTERDQAVAVVILESVAGP